MWKTFRRWNERTRMLVLMLTVLVPAAALILVSVLHLRSIQRDRAVEAAIQRDYQQLLAIAEKRIVAKAYESAEEHKRSFPALDDGEELDHFLATHPDVSHAFLYEEGHGLEFRSQPNCQRNEEFRAEADKLSNTFQKWFELEAKDVIEKLKKMEKKDGHAIYSGSNWQSKGDRWKYQSLILFQPHGATEDRPALAGYIVDEDYLKNNFFPQVLSTVLPEMDSGGDANHPQTVVAVRTSKESQPLVASAEWEPGPAEVERNFESVFPGLVLAAKLRGTTIADMSHRFLRTNFLILAGLSILLGAGIFLLYRSVSREMALAKLKSDFVSNVSHELRTPLSLIRLYAETLELGRIPTSQKQHEYYEIIRKESERLTALINNILDFSRIEAGRKEYEFRKTNIADLVRSTLESYRFQIEQNGFHYEQRIDENLPEIPVDREAIARSVLNLVNNAVKYSSTDKFIGVNVFRSNGAVNVQVVDHGIGIPPAEQHKIFEKFYRVGDPLVHTTKGSGLGLSLVRHIVQAHGGDVSVESTPGRGSKFTISLPLNVAAREAKGATA